MKKNIKRLLTLVLVVLFTQSIIAQDQQRVSREERMKQQKAELVKELKLNKDQIKKVDVADSTYQVGFAKMRESGDRESMRGNMTKMGAKRDSIYKTIFTKDQYKKYEKILETRMQNRGGRGRRIR